jgi:hypothetical protein
VHVRRPVGGRDRGPRYTSAGRPGSGTASPCTCRPGATAGALRATAAGLAGTTLVVSFLLYACALDALGHAVRDSAAAVVAAAGEPVVATYTRDEAADLLGQAGLSGIELLDAGRLRDRYLWDRPDLPLPGTTLIAIATV